jgi:hypothetical protein
MNKTKALLRGIYRKGTITIHYDYKVQNRKNCASGR